MYCIKDMQFVESHCELKFCKVLFDLRKRQLCILGMDLGQVLLGDVDAMKQNTNGAMKQNTNDAMSKG